MLSIIVAGSTEGVIGFGNALIWHLPSDLKHFRDTTLNKTVVMGKNTYLSIGKPLPKRINHVISSTISNQENITVFSSIQEWLEANHKLVESDSEDVFICGGKRIYEEFLPYTKRIYYSNVLVGKQLDHTEYDTKIFSVYDLIDSGQWDVKSAIAVHDQESYLLSDKTKPLTYTKFVLERK
jgi:dihydrofolate reductase